MLHGVAMETAGNGGESARQRMCIKFCHCTTYCRTPRACKLWWGTQKHSLLNVKEPLYRILQYEESFLLTEWILSLKCRGSDFSFSLFRGNKMLKEARADMSHTISKAANKQVHHHGWDFYSDNIMQITSDKTAKKDLTVVSKCCHGSIYWADMNRDGQYTADSLALQISIIVMPILSSYKCLHSCYCRRHVSVVTD